MFREPGYFVGHYCHGLRSAALAVPLLFGGCATQQQGQTPSQNQAEGILAQTERSKLPAEQRAAQYLAICESAENEMSRLSGSPVSPGAAAALAYDRASADVATILPALLRKHPGPRTLTVRNSRTGEAFLLRLESSRSGEYRPDFFQQILTAQRVKKKGLTVNVSHPGFGGPVVGVHHTFPVGMPPPRFEPLQGFRIPMTAIVEFDKASRPTTARVRLLDPDKVESAIVAGKPRMLAADHSAVYGSYWVFSYSTGNPIAYSAYLLRTDLADAQQALRFKQLILIGHSMGGNLARLQVTNSGRKTWDEAFGQQANQLYAELPETSLVKRALLFRANPAIKRVIFMSTPHRGATLASGGIGALGMRLIQLPSRIAAAIGRPWPRRYAKQLRWSGSLLEFAP